jgi:PST family polysaccharide transporter
VNKTMVKNILSLFMIQGAGYILPLITLPYLVRVLGPSEYGVLGFSLAFVQYFTLLVQYGFDLSATNKIAIHKDDKTLVSQVFWGVLFCKTILVILGALLMVAILLLVPGLKDYSTVIIVSYTSVVGAAYVPSWLFQGKEKMGWMAISNILAKIVTIPLIFIFVSSQADTWIVALITGAGFILGSLFSFYMIYREKWIEWTRPTLGQLKELIQDGRYIFLSNIAGSLYVNSIPVFLGFAAGPVTVGYYVAADRIRQAIQGLMSPVTSVFYPRISSLMSIDKAKGLRMIRLLLVGQNAVALLMTLLLMIFSHQIIDLFYGKTYHESISILVLLAPLIFFISVSTVLGVQGMLIIGMRKEFSQILWLGAILNTVIIFPLIWLASADGAAISVLFTEALVAILIVSKTKSIWRRS